MTGAKRCTVRVTDCEECPNFRNDYPHFPEECSNLEMKVERVDGKWPIPKSCPLPVFDDEWDDAT